MSCGWAKASARPLQVSLSCAVLCHILSLQYLSRASLHCLAGLPWGLFLSCGFLLCSLYVYHDCKPMRQPLISRSQCMDISIASTQNVPTLILWCFDHIILSPFACVIFHKLELSKSAVECQTRNRENACSNTPFTTVSKCGYFRSVHDAPAHSVV